MDNLYYEKKYQKYKMKYILYSKMNANNKLEGGMMAAMKGMFKPKTPEEKIIKEGKKKLKR
jgi:hypothetical protein